MEFTDDPFRNYRYEDPFNIKDPFDDEPPATSKSADQLDSFAAKDSSSNAFSKGSFNSGLGGRQSVPLPISSSSLSGRASAPLSKALGKPVLNEDLQLAWAAAESLKLEEARKQRQLDEEAELAYVLALSKQDAK